MDEEKEVKEVKKKKNYTGILLGIILILLILLGVCIFLLFQEKNNKENQKTADTEEKENIKQNTEENQEESFISLSLDDEMVVKANSLNPSNLCGQTALELEKRNRNVNEISSIEKIKMLSNCAGHEKTENGSMVIKEENIKKYFEDISFLERYTNGLPEGEHLAYGIWNNVRYENGQLVFIRSGGVGCEGPSQGSFLTLYSAKKNSKKLVLNYVTYYKEVNREDKQFFIYDFYKDETKKEYLGEGQTGDQIDINLFSGYQFVFDIADGNYQLEAINYLPLLTEE